MLSYFQFIEGGPVNASVVFSLLLTAASQGQGQPLGLDLSLGVTQISRVHPYGGPGARSFDASMPLFGARLRGQTWYAELVGQMMWTSITNRNTVASVQRQLFRSGRIYGTVSAEFADIAFRREDFRTSDVSIGTSREAVAGLAGIGFGFGSHRGPGVRLTALGGYYHNRYGTVMEFPTLTRDDDIVQSDHVILGARLEIADVALGPMEMGGSIRYLRLSGEHPAVLPDGELSATASVNVRVLRIHKKKSLLIGGFARFGPSRPSLITDKTFGIRGTFRLK